MIGLAQTQSYEIIKPDLSLSGRATIKCPFCEKSHYTAVPNYLRNRTVRVKCDCGESFPVLFDSRKHRRREAWLPGQYWDSSGKKDQMTVISISAAGVGFQAARCEPTVKLGETIQIRFFLNDGYCTCITTKGIVRSLNRNRIGVEFISLDEHQRKHIGLCLMSLNENS